MTRNEVALLVDEIVHLMSAMWHQDVKEQTDSYRKVQVNKRKLIKAIGVGQDGKKERTNI